MIVAFALSSEYLTRVDATASIGECVSHICHIPGKQRIVWYFQAAYGDVVNFRLSAKLCCLLLVTSRK
jgi:hypothetical protein